MNENLRKSIADFGEGKFLIVTDDETRENEGDLILLAEKANTEALAFMVRYTSGVICAAITSQIARNLKIPLMVKRNEDGRSTAFTITVDAIEGCTTGISAQERANTLNALADPKSEPGHFSRPGHIFPLIAVDGGLGERQGHTEAAIALCELANSYPVGVLSELVNDDGTMMRGAQLKDFADRHSIRMVSIEELTGIAPRRGVISHHDFGWADLPLNGGLWKITTYISPTGAEHMVLKYGENLGEQETLVRIHSECITGDVLGSLRCDCGQQLSLAIDEIQRHGSGLIIYLRDHEGRGIGLAEKISSYILQDQGQNTIQANLSLGHDVDARSYSDAIVILKALEIKSISLLTNNPQKSEALQAAGIFVNILPIQIKSNRFNKKYLETKRDELHHALGKI